MILYSIQESLPHIEQEAIRQLIDLYSRNLRLQTKHMRISSLDDMHPTNQVTTLLSVGDTLWQTRFLGAVSHILKKDHDLVIAHITPRTQNIPFAKVHTTLLKTQLKHELQTIAARKITTMPVFACDNFLFLNQLQLTTGQAAPTPLHIKASIGNSRYQLKSPGSTIRLTPLRAADDDASSALQLHILQEQSPKTQHTQPLFMLAKQKIASSPIQEDILHIPIKNATIHAETSLLFENSADQRTSRQFSIETLPWKLRVITAKNTPKDID